jgi:acetyltransferase-like isoleucine patch superfamily enzyme
MEMIKKIIKRICHTIYSLGRFEDLRLKGEERIRGISQIAEIHSTVWISEESVISNRSRPKGNIKIDANSRIMGDLFLFDSGGQINIGKDCFIGPLTRIWSAKKISIGNRVLIAHNVNIHDNISHPIDSEVRHDGYVNFGKTGMYGDADLKAKEVVIEDDVWIGFNSIILRGTTIGRGAIIGAGSVVTKDVDPWTINVGNPLRCVKRIK